MEDDDEPEYHQLFEYVFVVSLKEASKGKLTTEITYTYPPVSISSLNKLCIWWSERIIIIEWIIQMCDCGTELASPLYSSKAVIHTNK